MGTSSKAVIEILRKSIVCKGFSSNYGGSRAGAGKKKLEEIKPKETQQTAPVKRFIKPTLEEILAYCKEQNYSVTPQAFFDFYESKGWKVGNTPMKDWKAAVRNWVRNDKGEKKSERELWRMPSPKGKYEV